MHQLCLQNFYYELAGDLVRKGIDANAYASDVFRTLAIENDTWVIDDFFQKGMYVDPQNYQALHTAIELALPDVAKRLLDSGMDFDQYTEWATQTNRGLSNDTVDSLKEYWDAMPDRPEKAPEQNSGPTMAGL